MTVTYAMLLGQLPEPPATGPDYLLLLGLRKPPTARPSKSTHREERKREVLQCLRRAKKGIPLSVLKENLDYGPGQLREYLRELQAAGWVRITKDRANGNRMLISVV